MLEFIDQKDLPHRLRIMGVSVFDTVESSRLVRVGQTKALTCTKYLNETGVWRHLRLRKHIIPWKFVISRFSYSIIACPKGINLLGSFYRKSYTYL